MANPPPVRPWFRLASLRAIPPAPAPAPAPETRPAAPAPAAPETRPPVVRPAFRTSSAPSSPQTQPTRPPAPAVEPVAPPPPRVERTSAPASPVQKVPSPAQKVPSPVQKVPSPAQKVPSPVQKETISVPSDKNGKTQSPKTVKPMVQAPTAESPKVRLTAPPPSPLVLPPSQTMKTVTETEPPAEAEQKTVLVQKTVEKPKQRVHGEKASIPQHEKHGVPKEGKKTEEAGMRIITIAGENRGAFMEVIQSPSKAKKKKEGSESEKSSEEGDAKKKDKSHRGKASSSLPTTAFLNSNVQCVNNSLMYNASCTHHDPGVHFVLSKKPVGDGFQIKEQKD